MHHVMYLSLQQHTECATKTSFVPPTHPFLSAPEPLATIDLFTFSIVLSFLECHIIGITHSTWPLQTDFFCLVCGAQWRLIFCNSMDCSPPGSSAHGIFQRRRLEWVAISCCRGSSRPRDPTCISCVSSIGKWILYHRATWEAPSFA